MTPEQLKASIIQCAIQGKLVEQKDVEGTAEELYQQIQKEKQILINEGKIKKSKTLPAISEEEVSFDIPDSWKWIRLGEIVEIISGVSYDKKDVSKEGIRILRGGNIQSTLVKAEEDDVFLPTEYYDDSKQVRIGDIIYVASTGSKAVIGKPGFIDNDFPDTLIGAFLRICRPVSIKYTEYLKIIFSSEYYRKHIRDLAQGTNINNVKESYVTELAIPLPPLEEQHRIVAKIEKLLPYVDRYAEAYEKLEQFNAKFPEDMKKSILQYAIQGKLVEQRQEEGTAEELYQRIQEEKQRLIKEGKIKKEKPLAEITEDEIPFDIPESWKWVRVCSVGVTQTGNTPQKSHPEYFGNYVPFLGPGDIQNGNVNYDNQGLSEEGKEYGRVTPSDSVLQVCIGGSIGKCALVDREVTFNQQINSIYPLISDCKYVYYVLDSYYFKDYMKENSGGTATPIINRGLWDAIVIPLPPLEEQHRIVAKIEELLPFCERLVK
ncbi:MAG: restriction endonuclease subunit S [Eubacterium sp.]|nr:restriction endonuclease subunit S [Eubacterium sp.]